MPPLVSPRSGRGADIVRVSPFEVCTRSGRVQRRRQRIITDRRGTVCSSTPRTIARVEDASTECFASYDLECRTPPPLSQLSRHVGRSTVDDDATCAWFLPRLGYLGAAVDLSIRVDVGIG